MTEPRPVTPGEPIRAEAWNGLVSSLRERTVRGVGPGLTLSQTADGATLTIDGGVDRYAVPAVITAAPQGEDIPIEEAMYSVRIMGTGAELVNVVPVYGRRYQSGTRVKPARVGHYCRVVRMPISGPDGPTFTADLWILSEYDLTRRCATPPGSSGGGTTPPGGTDPPPPPPPPGSGTPGNPDSTPATPGGSF